MGRQDRQRPVRRVAQIHGHIVPGRRAHAGVLLAHQVPVGQGRLVAVVPIGDDYRRRGQRRLGHGQGLGVVQRPEAVGDAVLVGEAPLRRAHAGAHGLLDPLVRVVVDGEDLAEGALRLAEQEQSVSLRLAQGALVGQDAALAQGLQLHGHDYPAAAQQVVAGRGRVVDLLVDVQRGVPVVAQHARAPPLVQRGGRRGIVALLDRRVHGLVAEGQPDDVVGRAGRQGLPFRLGNHVIGRRQHGAHVADGLGLVA